MINISNVLTYLEFKDSMLAAEFGCGSADIALALAKKMRKGRVYAVDVQHERLSALEGKLKHEHLKNVIPVHGDLEIPKGSTLRDGTLDVVVIPNTLFQAEHKYGIMQEAQRVLKPGGQLLVIDWLKKNSLHDGSNLVKPEEAKALAQKSGFTLKKEFAAGDYHYGLVFTK